VLSDSHLAVKLTSHVMVQSTNQQHRGFVPGESLVEGHLAQMRKVFPNLVITTTSQNFAAHRELTVALLEIATNALPQKWYRKILPDGHLREYRAGEDTGIRSWHTICDDVYLLPKLSGWIIPNLIAIMHDMVRQITIADTREVWMLSGPDMINYLPTLMQDLRVLYDALRRRMDTATDITLNLVPFTYAKFVVRKSSKHALNELWTRLRDGSTNQHIRADYATLCPDLWTNTKRRVYFSQHDMTSPDDICVEEETLDLPLKEVERYWLKARADLPKELR
jgi:hypothetical protein